MIEINFLIITFRIQEDILLLKNIKKREIIEN